MQRYAREKRSSAVPNTLFVLNAVGNTLCIAFIIYFEHYSDICLLILTNFVIQIIPAIDNWRCSRQSGRNGLHDSQDYAELSKVQRFRGAAVPVIVGAVGWHIVAVIFGAYITTQLWSTFQFGILMSIITVLPLVVHHGLRMYVTNLAGIDHWSQSQSPFDDNGMFMSYCIGGACAGAWCGAVVLPLDWDRPWQVWPFPCAVGAILGQVIGWIITLRNRRKSKLAKDI